MTIIIIIILNLRFTHKAQSKEKIIIKPMFVDK